MRELLGFVAAVGQRGLDHQMEILGGVDPRLVLTVRTAFGDGRADRDVDEPGPFAAAPRVLREREEEQRAVLREREVRRAGRDGREVDRGEERQARNGFALGHRRHPAEPSGQRAAGRRLISGAQLRAGTDCAEPPLDLVPR